MKPPVGIYDEQEPVSCIDETRNVPLRVFVRTKNAASFLAWGNSTLQSSSTTTSTSTPNGDSSQTKDMKKEFTIGGCIQEGRWKLAFALFKSKGISYPYSSLSELIDD